MLPKAGFSACVNPTAFLSAKFHIPHWTFFHFTSYYFIIAAAIRHACAPLLDAFALGGIQFHCQTFQKIETGKKQNMKLPLVISILASLSLSAIAADLPKPDADGWIALFNGKDLTGWEGLEGYWSVVDGAIQCAETNETSKQSDLILTASKANPEKFANFELHYTWKMVTPGGNSGVQIRGVIDHPEAFHVGGYQADIDAGNSYTGIFYDEGGVAGGRGIMSNRGEKTVWDENNKRTNTKLEKTGEEIKKAIKPVGEWNECIVIANGNHLTYKINGEVVTDMIDSSPKARKDGVIGLQMHAGHTMTIQFKDFKIKMLP